MALDNATLVKLIGQSELLPEDVVSDSLRRARHLGCSIIDVLLGQGSITEDDLGKLLERHYGVPFVNLKKQELGKETLSLIPEPLAAEKGALAFNRQDDVVHVAMEDPTDIGLVELVKKTIGPGLHVKIFSTTATSIRESLRFYSLSTSKDQDESQEVADSQQSQSAITLIDTMIEDAVKKNASDIHIEGTADEVLIRFRIDGVLHDKLTLKKNMHEPLVARVKVMSELKLDEHRLPQDGNITYKTRRKEKLSLRVSVLPTVMGEKVVLRLLINQVASFDLNELGVSDKLLTLVESALTRPQGMILLTGPTGSGKTTTLYTMLGMLNKPDVNIITVEDPVENKVRRINQVSVNNAVGFTFANGLRSILRQDPDVIMVGEIRDHETAVIAVNAAMTGHIVLSSVHTNSSSGTIPRLIDLGVEPFLLASTLNLVISQRLVREICQKCCRLESIAPMAQKKLKEYSQFIAPKLLTTVKKSPVPVGCAECNFFGYRGRIGVFELLPVTESVRSCIIEKKSSTEIFAVARKSGMQTMLEDGLTKVMQKRTSIEEVLRVISD